MVSSAVLGRMWSWKWNWANRNTNRNSVHGGDHFITAFPHTRRSCGFKNGASLSSTSGVHFDTLRVLEWDKLCDSVASFAATSLGRQAAKTQLWSLSQSYQESLRLLQETNAAIQMHNHTSCSLSLSSINIVLVKSAIQHASRGSPVTASEALAVATMQEAADLLQLNLKAAIKEDADWYQRFMPLTPLIMDMVINPALVRSIQQVINEDGTVKDSASSALKQSREKVRLLEKKLHRLMDSIIGNELKETLFLEVCNIDGRVCLKSGTDQLPGIKGLLLSSNSSSGRIVEPLTVVPLNDELQQAKASMARAETDVLLMLTEKIKIDLDGIEEIANSVIKLDVINARAMYCLSFGGSSPNLLPPEDMVESFDAESHLSGEKPSEASSPTKKRWILYMPNAHHPLLLQQHRRNVQEARKVANNVRDVSVLEQARPVPVDFFIPRKTRVLIITGPNTGGKTISLKTVGLAALMAKSGLHVLSSESVQIPWFDSVFADIGDEQSLSQSLSTFSGHLKQISDIRSRSTNQSLVLLDEVGAGTNPLEGAALGMSLLESFGNNGALLTIATTHHGELKSLKYSNDVFENACMEFDEVNLKPTYKILWGVPGRSNAINVSKKLGLPSVIINNARDLYGAASAEINEVILDMERFKQEFQVLLSEAHHHLMFSRNLYEKLLLTRRRIREHGTRQRLWKVQQISESAATARSVLHKKVRQLRSIPARQSPQASVEDTRPSKSETLSATAVNSGRTASGKAGGSREKSTAGRTKVPEVGDEVKVSSLGRKATVLRVDATKGEIVVQAGNLKLKLKLVDIEV